MSRPPPLPLDRAATAIHTIAAIDALADELRSIEGLRSRAATARKRATTARTKLGRAFWSWRAALLSERADALEVKRRGA